MDLWGSLASQPNPVGGFQASERRCLKNRAGGTCGMTTEGVLWSSHVLNKHTCEPRMHTHMCTQTDIWLHVTTVFESQQTRVDGGLKFPYKVSDVLIKFSLCKHTEWCLRIYFLDCLPLNNATLWGCRCVYLLGLLYWLKETFKWYLLHLLA